ncbi:hypothetical protein LINGRAHAP2_LOCUS33677 [Linum grandiflorum]
MAPDGGRSSNLDHLQRTNISSKQQPPRRKVDSSAPIGAWSLSESQVLTGELGGSDTHRGFRYGRQLLHKLSTVFVTVHYRCIRYLGFSPRTTTIAYDARLFCHGQLPLPQGYRLFATNRCRA